MVQIALITGIACQDGSYLAELLLSTEVGHLQADPSQAKRRLGWDAKLRLRDLVRIMVDADLEAVGLPAAGEGKRCLADGRQAWCRRP